MTKKVSFTPGGITFLLITLFVHFTHAQESLSPVLSVVPPSPEAASMNKAIDIPVSYHTGLPQLSIPIHTITMEKIQVPVSWTIMLPAFVSLSTPRGWEPAGPFQEQE